MSISCAVLMCHTPDVIPAVAGHRARQCATTTRAMSDLAVRLCAHAPDVLVLVNSVVPQSAAPWSICGETPLRGDFDAFRAPQVGISLPGAPEAAKRLLSVAREAQLPTREIAGIGLDRGALVPLYFLQQAGWQGATLLVTLPSTSNGDEAAMGRAITLAADQAGQRWAIVASGDMSQRLTPNATDGYHPRAKDFDRIFRTRIEAGDLRGACTINSELRKLANERASAPCLVAAGAVDFQSAGQNTYAYEGPFGVGMLSAVLYEADVPREHGGTRARELWPWPSMLDIARQAMSAKLRYNPFRPNALPQPWNAPRGAFVGLRDQAGNERGCIGHVEPQHGTLAEEIAVCAALAVTHDTRFARVSLYELGGLDIEIAIVSKPEPVLDTTTLEPQRYGVVVNSGRYTGVQLPGVAGITTIEQQLTAAAVKGQLPAGRPWVISRFEVQRSSESQLRADLQAARSRNGW
jgi:AMMECR1 domain-containing protein/aromatic ring-opening dioxygenase catalytic subunit (LigB family)